MKWNTDEVFESLAKYICHKYTLEFNAKVIINHAKMYDDNKFLYIKCDNYSREKTIN